MGIFNWITNEDLINELKNDLQKAEKERYEFVDKYLQSELSVKKINDSLIEERSRREKCEEKIQELENTLYHLKNEDNNYFIVLDENDKLKRENKDLIEQADENGSKATELLTDYHKVCDENKKLYNLYYKAKEENKRLRKGMKK